MRDGFIAIRTNRRCTSISCRPRTSRAIRTCCARAAATSGSPTTIRSLNTVWPVRPNPGTNRAYQVGIDRPDGTLAKFTSVCAPLVYRGDRLPAELYGNVFVAEPAANLVSRIVLDDERADAARAQGVRAGRVPRVDRRALPARCTSRMRPTARCTSRTCIAASSSTGCR